MPLTKKRLKDERGQTFTELAMVLPILVVLILGIAQFGLVFNNYIALTDAARAAARKGAVSRQAGQSTDCQDAGYAAGTDLKNPKKPNGFNVTCTSSWAPGADLTVTATYPWSISLLDWQIKSGTLTTTVKERVE